MINFVALLVKLFAQSLLALFFFVFFVWLLLLVLLPLGEMKMNALNKFTLYLLTYRNVVWNSRGQHEYLLICSFKLKSAFAF